MTDTLIPGSAPLCLDYLQKLSGLGVGGGGFYLAFGQAFKPSCLPREINIGEAKQCYANAGKLALANPSLVYCEGFAVSKGLFPLHHAWCIDCNGNVIDPTWPRGSGQEFFGLALQSEFLHLYLARVGVWGIFSEHIPLEFLTRHPLEYLHPSWTPSRKKMESSWASLRNAMLNRKQ